MNASHQTRREFLQQVGTGLVVAAAFPAVAQQAKNPLAYNVDRFARTEPRLLQFQEERTFSITGERPRRLALGPDSRLYVATAGGVLVYDVATGEQVRHVPLSEPARCVAAGPDGVVYAGIRRSILRIDVKGNATPLLQQPGERTWFTGLAVGPGNELFAADAGNRVVLRLDSTGKVLGRIGEKNKERNVPGLIVPSPYLDVKAGSDGLLRVNNPGRHRVELYTVEGDLEQFWGSPGNAIDAFCGCCNPIGVAPLPDGSCITCEKGLPRVKTSAADGALLSVVAGTESFPENAKAGAKRDSSDGTLGGVDAAVDHQGRVYVLDLIAGSIRVMRRKETRG